MISMAGKKIKITNSNGLEHNMQIDREKNKLITLEDFFILHKKFMQDKALEGLATRTLDEHVIHLNYFKKYIDSALRSSVDSVAVNSEIFKGYLYYMLYEKKYSPYTANVRIRSLKCYLRWLYLEKYSDENYGTKFKLVKTPLDTTKPLEDEVIKKILKACDKNTYTGLRDYTLMITILDCGIRIGEACELKIDDIDLKQGLINIRGTVAKTRTSRQIPISSYTCKLINNLINMAKENNCEYIFMSLYGGKIQKQNITLSFRRIGEKAGIKQKCTPYVFRHTFASNAVKSGSIDVFSLQRIMGHSNINTTRKYVQLENKDLIKKHNKALFINKYIK